MHALDRAVTALMRDVATRLVLPRFRALGAHEIHEKTPGDLVTIADHDSEAALGEGLARLLPDAAIIGEEGCAADPALLDRLDEQALAWVIDPLDGTMNFAEGKTPFALMVALLADGVREAGWILDPVTGRICHAARGMGAYVDGEKVQAKPTGRPLPLASISTFFIPPERRDEIERRSAGKLEIVPIPRCAGEQYPRLALGQNDIALYERTLPWDHAPGALFLEEAGGKVARPDGSPYQVGDRRSGMVAAASPALWDEAARVLFA